MLEEDPELCHGGSVDDLHELSDVHVLVALEALERHVALVSELLEHVSCMLVTLVAPEQNSRLLTKGRGDKNVISVREGAERDSLLGAKVLCAELLLPATALDDRPLSVDGCVTSLVPQYLDL